VAEGDFFRSAFLVPSQREVVKDFAVEYMHRTIQVCISELKLNEVKDLMRKEI
jgi:hypothetical protein